MREDSARPTWRNMPRLQTEDIDRDLALVERLSTSPRRSTAAPGSWRSPGCSAGGRSSCRPREQANAVARGGHRRRPPVPAPATVAALDGLFAPGESRGAPAPRRSGASSCRSRRPAPRGEWAVAARWACQESGPRAISTTHGSRWGIEGSGCVPRADRQESVSRRHGSEPHSRREGRVSPGRRGCPVAGSGPLPAASRRWRLLRPGAPGRGCRLRRGVPSACGHVSLLPDPFQGTAGCPSSRRPTASGWRRPRVSVDTRPHLRVAPGGAPRDGPRSDGTSRCPSIISSAPWPTTRAIG